MKIIIKRDSKSPFELDNIKCMYRRNKTISLPIFSTLYPVRFFLKRQIEMFLGKNINLFYMN